MGQLSSRRLLTLAVCGLLLVTTAACGGSEDGKKADAKPSAPAQRTEVRWPRYWATTDNAETGSDTKLVAKFYAGYDDASVVYNGQDVIRFLDPTTGKQKKQQVVPGARIICATLPSRNIEDHTVLLATGQGGESRSCEKVNAVDTRTGAYRWGFGYKPGQGGDIRLAQRDGKSVFIANGVGGAGSDLAVLDTATGKPVWEHGGDELVFGKKARNAQYCYTNASLAARDDVIVALVSCDRKSAVGTTPKVIGIDLGTGKTLWSSKYWMPANDGLPAMADEVLPHSLDGEFFPATHDSDAVRVDAQSGKVTKLASPDLKKLGSSNEQATGCNDSMADDGLQWNNACVFSTGSTLVYATSLSRKSHFEMNLQGADAKTGKPLWTWDRKVDQQAGGSYHSDFEFLGLNADRTEFLVVSDAAHLERLDVKTGKLVGRGLLAPPLELARFAVSGPKFLLVRGTPGITDVKSGLDYYKTNAD